MSGFLHTLEIYPRLERLSLARKKTVSTRDEDFVGMVQLRRGERRRGRRRANVAARVARRRRGFVKRRHGIPSVLVFWREAASLRVACG